MKLDITDVNTLDAIVEADYNLEKIDQYPMRSNGSIIHILRLKSNFNGRDFLMLPVKRCNTILNIMHFKEHEVTMDYTYRVISAFHGMALEYGELTPEIDGRVCTMEQSFIDECYYGGFLAMHMGICPISGANLVWCVPMPAGEDMNYFTHDNRHKAVCMRPKHFKLPDSVLTITDKKGTVFH